MKKLLCILIFAPLIGYADKMIKNTQITALSEIECETACECLELLDSQLKNLLNNLSCDSCQIHAFKILEEIAIKNYSYHNLLACDNWFQVDYRFGAIFGAGGLSYWLEEFKISKERKKESLVETITEKKTPKNEVIGVVIKEEKPAVEEVIEEAPEVNRKALYVNRKALNSSKNNNHNKSEGEEGKTGYQRTKVFLEKGTQETQGIIGEDGIDHQLVGRQVVFKAKPLYNIQFEGKVVVSITVDRLGNVIYANPGIKGSTTFNEQLLKRAMTAALKTKFDTKQTAPKYQIGAIVYDFILN